jgi:hypothetical protein
MNSTTLTGPAGQLASSIAIQLGRDADWAPALASISTGIASLHLAVLAEPFLGWLLDGSKTIESRFSKVRCAPYGVLTEGDVVAVKRTGGLVVGAFQAGPVTSIQLSPGRISDLRRRFAAQIRADTDEFWDQRASCSYATLVDVRHVRTLTGLAFPKKDRRGWVQLTRQEIQQVLL